MEQQPPRSEELLINNNGNDELDDDLTSANKSDSDFELPHEEVHARIDTNCFRQQYNCFPLSHINKTHLEDGNRILMPASALDRLLSLNVVNECPMVFEIRNPYSDRHSHCGVLEFSAEEGSVFLPHWMMKNLQLEEGSLVKLKSTTLPKGTYVKLQPHSMKFLGLNDHKSVLETAMRDFACLTSGDTIMLRTYDYEQYYIDILETKPAGAISVFETDCEVDFALPSDYKKPEKKPKTVIKVQEEKGKEETKFKPFSGVARRLDGQPSVAPTSDSFTTSMVKADALAAAADDSNNRPCRRPGKLVFGPEDAGQPWRKFTRVSNEDDRENIWTNSHEQFQPFTGRKYTLGG